MSRKVNILSMSGRMFHMTSLFEYIVYEMKLRTFTSRLFPNGIIKLKCYFTNDYK